MVSKIAVSVLIAFVISFSALVLFQYYFQDTLSIRQKEFFSRSFDPSVSKIVLLGSSHVGQLDATHIEAIIAKQHSNYVVFNLANSADTPNIRLSTLDETLSLKPKIVVYGLGYRDFTQSESFKADQILPDPKQYFDENISLERLGIDDDFLKNPKLITLNALRDFFGVKVSESIKYEFNTPFVPYGPLETDIIEDLEKIEEGFQSNSVKIRIDSSENNKQVRALKKILDEFEKEGVKVVIFITPHNEFYLKAIPEVEKQNFADIMNYVSSEYDVKLYNLTTKYSKMNIWRSINHIAHNSEAAIYDEDIASMILKMIDQ